jgi:hypothetical protein
MNNTPDIAISTTICVTLPEILHRFAADWSHKEIVEGIIDFVSTQPDEKFEDSLIAALNKFKTDNAPVDVAETTTKQNIKP